MQTGFDYGALSALLNRQSTNRPVPVDAASHVSHRVRQVIAGCGLSLAELQRLTAERYGKNSPFHIPNDFFARLRRNVSPHLCQVVTLSNLTEYLLTDWLALFGFDLQQVTRLQVKLHPERTIIVWPSERLSWANSMQAVTDADRTSSNVVQTWDPARRFLFAKIGTNDGMAFPELMPGSIVRVDTTRKLPPRPGDGRHLYLVEHVRGLSCCYVTRINDHEILLTPNYLPYPCLRYRLGEQAVILGTVDAELRPLKDVPIPAPSRCSSAERRLAVRPAHQPLNLSVLLRTSRQRIGLRFREAQAITREICEALGSEEYAVALGSLSDYEASNAFPRHIPKVISLCIAYAIDFVEYLAAAGISMYENGKHPLPTGLITTCQEMNQGHDNAPGDWTSWETLAHLPPSLLQAFVDAMYGGCSLQWLNHPGTRAGTLKDQRKLPAEMLLIDRSATRFERATWSAVWQRPVYLIRDRSGKYLYGFCTFTDGLLTVHQDPANSSAVESFARHDVEVVGRVVAVLRNRTHL